MCNGFVAVLFCLFGYVCGLNDCDMSGNGKLVNLAGEVVETPEMREQKMREAFEADRQKFMREGMGYLNMLIDELCGSQRLSNELGAYETHRVLSRMGVRLAWLRAGISQAVGSQIDILLAGASGFELWDDNRVRKSVSNADLLALHQQLTRIGMQLINLSNMPLVRGDIALAVARIEEAKEVSLIEYQEITSGELLVKLKKSDTDGKEESDVPEAGGQ